MPSLSNMKVKLGLSTSGFASGAAKAKSSLGSIEDKVDDLNNQGLGSFADSLGKEGSNAGRKFGSGLKSNISSSFGEISSSVTGAMQGMLVSVGALLGALPLLAVAAAGGMVAALGGGIFAVGAMAVGTTDDMKKEFSDFKEFAIDAFRDAAAPLKPVLKTLLDVGKDVINELAPVFNDFFSSTQGPLIDFIESLGDAFTEMKPVIPEIADAFNELLKSLGPEMSGIFESLADGIISITDSIQENPDSFTNLITGLASFANGIMQTIGFINKFATTISIVVVVVMAALALVLAAFGWPVAAIAALVAAIVALVGFVIMHFDTIKNAIVGAWQWVKEKTIAAWNATKNFVVQSWKTLKNTAVSAWNSLKNTIVGAWNSVKSTVTDGVTSVIDFVSSIPGKATDAVGDLGSLLVDKGKALIQGFIDGIKNMVGEVKDTASDIASTVKDYLPSSPAKEGPLSGKGSPDRSGNAVSSMMASGMRDELSNVDAASMELSSTAQPTAARPRTSGVSREPQRIELNVTGTNEELKRLIRKMVRTDGRGNVQTALGRS